MLYISTIIPEKLHIMTIGNVVISFRIGGTLGDCPPPLLLHNNYQWSLVSGSRTNFHLDNFPGILPTQKNSKFSGGKVWGVTVLGRNHPDGMFYRVGIKLPNVYTGSGVVTTSTVAHTMATNQCLYWPWILYYLHGGNPMLLQSFGVYIIEFIESIHK